MSWATSPAASRSMNETPESRWRSPSRLAPCWRPSARRRGPDLADRGPGLPDLRVPLVLTRLRREPQASIRYVFAMSIPRPSGAGAGNPVLDGLAGIGFCFGPAFCFRAATAPPILETAVLQRRAARGPRSAGSQAGSLTGVLTAAEVDPARSGPGARLPTGSYPTEASRAARRHPAVPRARPHPDGRIRRRNREDQPAHPDGQQEEPAAG